MFRAVLAVALVVAWGTAMFAMPGDGQQTASQPSPESIATEAINSGLRRLGSGEYEGAMRDFQRAASLVPNMYRAHDGLGRAYLGLNQVDDAKQAYLRLFATDRTNAAVLMRAMMVWVEKRRNEPGGVDPSVVASFDAWVRERAELAAKTANMAHNAPDWK